MSEKLPNKYAIRPNNSVEGKKFNILPVTKKIPTKTSPTNWKKSIFPFKVNL